MASSPSPTTWRSLATLAPRSASLVRRTSPGLSSTRRMWIASSMGHQLVRQIDIGQGEVECGAMLSVAIEPDPAAEAADDFLAQRQTDPGPRVFAATVKPLEHEEDPVAVHLGNADAVVLHRELPGVGVSCGGHADHRADVRGDELQSVRQQVAKDESELA